MSNYTTTVRFICEHVSGFDKSQDYSNIDKVLENSWDKIFDSDLPYYKSSNRSNFFKNILRHFYFREIGFETPALWEFFLNEKLRCILPYYNKLFIVNDMSYDVLDNTNYYVNDKNNNDSVTNTKGDGNSTDVTTTSKNYVNNTIGSVNTEEKSNTSSNLNRETNEDKLSKFSDTPQGSVNNLLSGTYLTNVTKDDNTIKMNEEGDTNVKTTLDENNVKDETWEEHDKTTTTNEYTNNTNSNTNVTYDGTKHVHGKTGTSSYSQLVKEYNENLLNVTLMLYNDIEDLFMSIW